MTSEDIDGTGPGSAAFPTLSEDQLARLRSFGTGQDVREGDVIFRPGDETYDLVLIDSGVIDIVLEATPETEEVLVTRHTAGRFLGELNMLTGQLVYLTARVVEPGHIHRISPDRFRKLMAEDAELSAIVLTAFQARRQLIKNVASRSIEIIGKGSTAGSLSLRTYATRLELPHVWFEADSVAGLALMKTAALTADELPAVIVSGTTLRNATPGILAQTLGLSYHKRQDSVDLTVVGAGPAGLAAAVYGASEGLVTILLDSVGPGGQAAASSRIENYVGFPNGISGIDLTGLASLQALKFGAQLYAPCTVVRLESSGGKLRAVLSDGTDIETGAVIVTSGAHYRSLPVDRWNEFEGAGIYYAATELEARACSGRPVAVVGGANSAGQAALFLASRGSAVSLVIRGHDISAGMSAYLVERLVVHPQVTILTSTEIVGLGGDAELASVRRRNRINDAEDEAECSGLFCFIGATPATDWLSGVALEPDGFIRTDVRITAEQLGPEWADLGRSPLPFETTVPRVFAAGDVRFGSMKRVAAAVGEGASAVASVHAALAWRP